MFKINKPDIALSPYTGMNRNHWLEAGRYLLEGVFGNIHNIEEPIVMPRKETKISYPHLDASEEEQGIQRKAEIFEGLTRSFFIASVLIKNEPNMVVNGIKLKDYYKRHILKACTKGDATYVGNYQDMQEAAGKEDFFRSFQQTVESCALVIGLQACREEIWLTYTKMEKDLIADFISSFAHGNTVPQNWRLFNMLDLAFLHMEGYEIDKEIMADHGQAILNYTVGDGWYRDGQCFDYYSCWAFNLYTPIWNQWYGNENEPYLAARFEECSNQLMVTYADFFDEEGFTNMWGRSCIYRNAATSPLSANFMLKNPMANPGRARRIASGSLLQFLTRDDFLHQGIPTLGFYDQFTPLVQGYSCAESPLWLGKAFLCLEYPENHPFWSAVEENGCWEILEEGQVKETILNGPALCFSNHKSTGETILRTGKVFKKADDVSGLWNYGKLNYNTKYPWEATIIKNQEEICESQQYLLRTFGEDKPARGNLTFWCGEKEGVLYRRQFFNGSLDAEQHWMQAINLADFPVSRGIFRVDKLRLIKRPIKITLGSYGFPDNISDCCNKTQIYEKEEVLLDGSIAKAIILSGESHTGRKIQMAMTIYQGWEQIEVISSKGTNPDSENSLIIFASMEAKKQYGGKEPYLLISQVITGERSKAENHDCIFTQDELFPIREIHYDDSWENGAYGTTQILMKDGSKKNINFEGIEASF